jgi:hypothetical protein
MDADKGLRGVRVSDEDAEESRGSFFASAEEVNFPPIGVDRRSSAVPFLAPSC